MVAIATAAGLAWSATATAQTEFKITANENVSITEEPGAVIPHAGICEGDVWATGVSTSTIV
jgi:hypothetical protein